MLAGGSDRREVAGLERGGPGARLDRVLDGVELPVGADVAEPVGVQVGELVLQQPGERLQHGSGLDHFREAVVEPVQPERRDGRHPGRVGPLHARRRRRLRVRRAIGQQLRDGTVEHRLGVAPSIDRLAALDDQRREIASTAVADRQAFPELVVEPSQLASGGIVRQQVVVAALELEIVERPDEAHRAEQRVGSRLARHLADVALQLGMRAEVDVERELDASQVGAQPDVERPRRIGDRPVVLVRQRGDLRPGGGRELAPHLVVGRQFIEAPLPEEAEAGVQGREGARDRDPGNLQDIVGVAPAHEIDGTPSR